MTPICLFGGTFDPPHLGHLILAELICDLKSLECIYFLPNSIPPHKKEKKITPVSDRLGMLNLATDANPRFLISRYEIDKEAPSYSIDTVQYFAEKYNLAPSDIFFLIGADSLLQLHTWRQPDELIRKCRMLVMPRPGCDLKKADSRYLEHVEILDLPLIGISATTIRERVKNGESIRYMVPDSVREYIEKKGLYREEI